MLPGPLAAAVVASKQHPVQLRLAPAVQKFLHLTLLWMHADGAAAAADVAAAAAAAAACGCQICFLAAQELQRCCWWLCGPPHCCCADAEVAAEGSQAGYCLQ
jgi:hypothetical protein